MYAPREQNTIQQIFQDHFAEFEEIYEERYAKEYGTYNIIRIKEAAEKFITCGDWNKGIARIKCTNPDCGHDFFLPLSCKCFYLCPSCHQKRLLLFSERLCNEVLLKAPHRQFVMSLPKFFRPYLRYDKELYSDISKLISKLITDYYNELAGKKVTSGMVISYASAGDFCRWNPHYHCIILEGGFDENNNFIYLPIQNTDKLAQVFRQRVIQLFVEKELINKQMAKKSKAPPNLHQQKKAG